MHSIFNNKKNYLNFVFYCIENHNKDLKKKKYSSFNIHDPL